MIRPEHEFTLALVLVVAVAVMSGKAEATHRSMSARAEFVRSNPCPSTGKPKMPCPGYVVDHGIPLCAGGPDNPANMAWQRYRPESLQKDLWERQLCKKTKP